MAYALTAYFCVGLVVGYLMLRKVANPAYQKIRLIRELKAVLDQSPSFLGMAVMGLMGVFWLPFLVSASLPKSQDKKLLWKEIDRELERMNDKDSEH